MVYTVSLTGPAEADAYAAFERIREVAPTSAARWLTDLFAAIRTLATLPARCPVIAEADEFGYPVRHLLYGKRSGVYRILFDIQEDAEEGRRVRVLRIWHSARDAITAADIATEHEHR